MDLIPAQELEPKTTFNFAPMIDFLFLMLSLFATLAISKVTLFDTNIDLVQLKPEKENSLYQSEVHNVNLNVDANGKYFWTTEFQNHPMENLQAVQNELIRQYDLGLFPKDKSKTEILLHIDKRAEWEPISKLLFTIREAGFHAYPVYEPEKEDDNDKARDNRTPVL